MAVNNMKVLISGSGIAGSVFAFWLLRAYPDARTTIVEKASSLRLTGASVDIRSSAVDIIKLMGAEEAIRKAATKEEGWQFIGFHGAPVATFWATGREDVQSITSEFEIFRGELGRILIEPVLDSVDLIYDESVESYEQHDDGVLIKLSRSQKTEKFDLLVAADGLGSAIRGTMLNSKPREQIVEEGLHVSYFTIKKDLPQGSKLAKWYATTGGRSIFIRPDPSPEGLCRASLINATWSSDTATRTMLNDKQRAGDESYKRFTEECFKDAGWLAPEVLEGMRDSEDFYCSLFAQVHSPKLQDGRVVLLGDAGYATPGIGTSLAIMGGYVLAGELLRSGGDTSVATRTYEELMQPFVKREQHQPSDRAAMLLSPQTRWGISIRNTIFWIVSTARLDQIFMSLAAWVGWSENKLSMPPYAWPEP